MSEQISDEVIWSIDKEIQTTPVFITYMGASGILTAVALLTNSVPVLIGAMVVAPLLPPIQLIAFGIAGAHYRLVLKGLYFSLGGILFAILFTALSTYFLNAMGILENSDNLLQKPLLEERVRPGAYSWLVAATAGVAGTLAIANNKTDALVGVVASVALVPAVGAGTIALISNDMGRAIGGYMLFAVNFIIFIGIALMVLAVAGNTLSRK